MSEGKNKVIKVLLEKGGEIINIRSANVVVLMPDGRQAIVNYIGVIEWVN